MMDDKAVKVTFSMGTYTTFLCYYFMVYCFSLIIVTTTLCMICVSEFQVYQTSIPCLDFLYTQLMNVVTGNYIQKRIKKKKKL